MQEQTKQNIRGVVYVIPIVILIAVLWFVARPVDRYTASQNRPQREAAADSTRYTLRPFDPNTADYRTLVESGLSREVAVGIIRWREAGKRYRIKEDLALCYAVTDSIYYAIEPYIIIGEEYSLKPAEYSLTEERDTKATIELEPFTLDTVTAPYLRTLGFSIRQADLVIRYREMIGGYRSMDEFAECYAVDSAMAERLRPYIIFPKRDSSTIVVTPRVEFPIEVNSADSTLLCRVSGIGAKSAAHIMRYRELLGGYYSVEQISELKVVTDENFQRILPQIWCDSAKIKKICINFASPKELEVHPYVSNRMLKRIVNHRELKGGWSSIEEMIEDKIFSTEEAARIAPYLDFSDSQE